jgi:hypothetical protein
VEHSPGTAALLRNSRADRVQIGARTRPLCPHHRGERRGGIPAPREVRSSLAWRRCHAASIFSAPGPMTFIALTPCRLMDTRSAYGLTGAFGPLSLPDGAPAKSRSLVPHATCHRARELIRSADRRSASSGSWKPSQWSLFVPGSPLIPTPLPPVHPHRGSKGACDKNATNGLDLAVCRSSSNS